MLGLVLCLSAILHLSSTQTLITDGIPDGYILQITPTCGSDATVDASIAIVTDLNANAKAHCDGAEVNFTTANAVNYHLEVGYPRVGSSASCIFWQRNNSRVFVVNVVVSYGEEKQLVHNKELEYTISCTFDPKSTNRSDSQDIVEGLIAPTEIQTNVGSVSAFTFILELVDVMERSLASEIVNLGRTVLLKAETDAVGLRPVSCDAIDGTKRYAILRAGCGDGIVFDKTEGFTTAGNKTLSPYFKAFTIDTAVVIDFECIFVECPGGAPCNGSSCTNER